MANNITTNFTEESLKVGNTVYISLGTDDEDLADYLEEHGDCITITEVEIDGDELTGNFWGISADGEDCPYHLEWRDVYAVNVTEDDDSKSIGQALEEIKDAIESIEKLSKQ